MMTLRGLALGAVLMLVGAAPAAAAPDLTLTATHARATFLRATAPNATLYTGTLTLTVANAGPDPTDASTVTVTDTLPAGLSALINNPGAGAGPVAASGTGWTCTGTRCTRADALAAGASYPPITVTVAVASNAGASLRNAPTVAGGGDAGGGSASDTIGVVADACPNGWYPGTPIFDSGVPNPERADGCTLLDLVFNQEPFADRAAFVAAVDGAASAFGLDLHAAAERAPFDPAAPDNSCTTRVALTFDDGPSYYRPQTLAALRAKQVPTTFFDTGMRLQANPQITRAELADGHTVLLHTYDHPNLNGIPASVLGFEVTDTAAMFTAASAPLTFKVLRPPFLSITAATQAALAALGFTATPNPISATDWDPSRSAAQIRDGIVSGLRPGVAILLHDGPVDSPAGQATEDSIPLIIDAARQRGYCFGTVDPTGMVSANRYVSGGQAFPQVTNPVPYLPLAYAGTPPAPSFTVPQPLRIKPAHAPGFLHPGEPSQVTLTVSNPTDTATDGSTTTVTDALPAGLTGTGASGTGWTCGGTNSVTCTRNDVLAAGASFPPITIAVTSAKPGAVTNTAKVTGRSGNVWVDQQSEQIVTGVPASGDVAATVPAQLALALGPPATFGAFVPGVARTYSASTTATVTSTAGDATLTVSDPGHLSNGAFALPQPLQVGPLPAWSAPVSNDVQTLSFQQAIGATDALRTGPYSTTLTFTLSTTNP